MPPEVSEVREEKATLKIKELQDHWEIIRHKCQRLEKRIAMMDHVLGRMYRHHNEFVEDIFKRRHCEN